MPVTQSYVIENDRRFVEALNEAAAKVDDLRFAMGEIARDWFKSNKSIFNLKGSGQYPALSPDYQAAKDKKYGRRLPILVGSGSLRDSISGTPNEDSIVRIGKISLIIGTKVPHGIFHQSDAPRSKMPLRKFLFIGPEAPRSAPSQITGRLERFMRIIELEVQRKLN